MDRGLAAAIAERDMLAERVRQLEAVLLDTSWHPLDWGLTPSECTALNVLALRRLATHDAIFTALYGSDPNGGPDDEIIKIWMLKLRRKLAPFGIHIRTCWGEGYRLDDVTRIWLCQLWKAAA